MADPITEETILYLRAKLIALKDETAKLKDEKRAVAFWFGRYGRHDPTCNRMQPRTDNTCTCGLIESQKEARRLEE